MKGIRGGVVFLIYDLEFWTLDFGFERRPAPKSQKN
jgi:hypothetical protein